MPVNESTSAQPAILRCSVAHGDKRGVSLVEIMVEITVLALVFASSFAAIGQGIAIIESARESTRAAQILQNEIENIRTLNWSAISALPSTSNFALGSEFPSEFLTRYVCNRAITSRRTDQKEVTLTMSWTGQDGVQRNRSYFTYVTKEGINDFYYRTF
jgi:Tfp pilus assembly protein PilV